MELATKFEKGKASHTYQRIDPSYRVDLFVGYNDDGNMSLVITEDGAEERVLSSKLISVTLNRRTDNKLMLSFDLLDDAYSAMFIIFCKDIIVVCEKAGKDMAISTALLRWKYWKEMFGKRNNNLLDKTEIKGVIGELYEMKLHMIPEYGQEEAVRSWMGPMLGHKDFEIANTWYEVKSINVGAIQIKINSLEQLESDEDGHLVVVRLDETSETNAKAVNLNSMVLSVADMIDDPEVLEEYRIKLNNLGYDFDPEYEKINFVYEGTEYYTINSDFPRIRRQSLSTSIGNAQYTIMVNGIAEFKEN